MLNFAAMIGKEIDTAIHFLEQGDLVALPTETVYGLAGNALNEHAILKIYSVKNRPAFDPLIIHTSTVDRIHEYTLEFPEPLRVLAKSFMPGPLTLLLPRKTIIPDLITSGMPRVAVRIPNHPTIQQILSRLAFPIAAPSANPFGYISPTTAYHVEQQLGTKIPYILDGGPCQVGVESTIIGMEHNQVVVFRQGGLAIESVEALIGSVSIKPHSTSNPAAPGMLKSHYAPSIRVVQEQPGILLEQYAPSRIGLLRFRCKHDDVIPQHQVVLSPTGNVNEAARNLFAALRRLDQLDIDIIGVESVPNQGLGRAINDRLRRAAAPKK